LFKILPFDPPPRNWRRTSPPVLRPAWSTDLKDRAFGLIATKIGDSEKFAAASGPRPTPASFSQACGRYRGISAAAACGSRPRRGCAGR
jgi:hypothetical protein